MVTNNQVCKYLKKFQCTYSVPVHFSSSRLKAQFTKLESEQNFNTWWLERCYFRTDVMNLKTMLFQDITWKKSEHDFVHSPFEKGLAFPKSIGVSRCGHARLGFKPGTMPYLGVYQTIGFDSPLWGGYLNIFCWKWSYITDSPFYMSRLKETCGSFSWLKEVDTFLRINVLWDVRSCSENEEGSDAIGTGHVDKVQIQTVFPLSFSKHQNDHHEVKIEMPTEKQFRRLQVLYSSK